MALPTPASVVDAADVSADCAICYAYLLPHPTAPATNPGSTPDVHCSNAACCKPFHAACLAEWLQVSSHARNAAMQRICAAAIAAAWRTAPSLT